MGHVQAEDTDALMRKFMESTYEKDFLQLQKINLFVPVERTSEGEISDEEEGPEEKDELTDEELRLVQQNLEGAPTRSIQKVIVAHGEDPKEKEVEAYRKKIHDDYDGIVLRDEIIRSPPERGPHGYAYIPLKHDAAPTRQKPIIAHGDKRQAYEKFVKDWIEKEFIERP